MDGGFDTGGKPRRAAGRLPDCLTHTAPEREALARAFQALYDAGIITELLLDMAEADISGRRPVQGPNVQFLAKQLRKALDLIDPALASRR